MPEKQRFHSKKQKRKIKFFIHFNLFASGLRYLKYFYPSSIREELFFLILAMICAVICRIFRTYCTLLSNCCVLCHITSTAMHVLYPRMGVSSKRYRSELWNNILLASPIFHRYNHWLLILVEPSTKSSYEKPTVSGSEADSEGILDLEKNITIN